MKRSKPEAFQNLRKNSNLNQEQKLSQKEAKNKMADIIVTTGEEIPGKEIIKILEQLGFSIVMEVSKRRTNWWKQPITLSLDDVEGLGKFIEVEILTSNSHSTLHNDKKRLLEFTRGLFPKWNGKNERKSYLELRLNK